MNFDELFAGLAALPAPESKEGQDPQIVEGRFSEANPDDLKAIALGRVLDDWDDEKVSNAAVQAYRVIAMRGDVKDLPFFMEVLAVWDGLFVEEVLSEEFEWVMSQFGKEVIPPALEIFGDVRIPQVHRTSVLDGLSGFLKAGIGVEEIEEGLSGQLRELRPERVVNGFLICVFMEYCPGKFHDEIVAAFEANVVDVSITGDREDTEIDLGAREERETESTADIFELENELSMLFRKEQLGEFPSEGSVFEKADYVLQLYRQEGGASCSTVLDGVFAVVICSPVIVRPAALFMLPWDLSEASPDRAPNIGNQKEADRVGSALMDFYNEINESINEMSYVPSIQWFESEEDENRGKTYPEPWLLGVLMGARYLEENLGENDFTRKIADMSMEALERCTGGEVFDVNSVVEFVSPLIEALLLARHQEKEKMKVAPPRGVNLFPGVEEKVAKVGRNDPCPCGSGRKFKKCCAN